MADTYTIINGNNIKLVDNGDGTFSLATEATGSALPTGAATLAKQDAIIAAINASPSIVIASSSMELYGASTATRPAANAVPAGTTFTVVDSATNFPTTMSNGVDSWEEV